MSGPMAFRAVYSDWKLVKTRGVIQVVLEVPLADADAAYDVLGGMPQAGKERWFGVAALKSDQKDSTPSVQQPQPVVDKPQAGAKREWRDMQPAQQAALRCNDVKFRVFLRDEYEEIWRETAGFMSGRETTVEADRAAECVRMFCGVQSRSELNTNHKARVIWHQLDDHFQAWQRIDA